MQKTLYTPFHIVKHRGEKMPWKTLNADDKSIKYHVSEGDEYYVDEVNILENNRKIIVKYLILPNEACDLLIINTNDTRINVCFDNNYDHEDPFFTFSDYYHNRDPEEIAYEIINYILNILQDSLNLS